MKRWRIRVIAGIALAGGILLINALLTDGAGGSESSPAAWRSMEAGVVQITAPGGETRALDVRIADEGAERAQGMQHLPARVVRDNPIWFVFPKPRRVGWHMRNVRVALDIAYVDETGRVIEVERMTPNSSGYGIDAPIAAALEVAAGQAERLGIERGTRLMLQGD